MNLLEMATAYRKTFQLLGMATGVIPVHRTDSIKEQAEILLPFIDYEVGTFPLWLEKMTGVAKSDYRFEFDEAMRWRYVEAMFAIQVYFARWLSFHLNQERVAGEVIADVGSGPCMIARKLLTLDATRVYCYDKPDVIEIVRQFFSRSARYTRHRIVAPYFRNIQDMRSSSRLLLLSGVYPLIETNKDVTVVLFSQILHTKDTETIQRYVECTKELFPNHKRIVILEMLPGTDYSSLFADKMWVHTGKYLDHRPDTYAEILHDCGYKNPTFLKTNPFQYTVTGERT